MPFRLGTTGPQPLPTVVSPAFCLGTAPQGCQHRGSWQDHLPGSLALVFRLRSRLLPSPPSDYSHRTLCCCLLPRGQRAIIRKPSQSGNQNATQRQRHALDELERHRFGDPETTLHLRVRKDRVTGSRSQVIAVVFTGPEAKSPLVQHSPHPWGLLRRPLLPPLPGCGACSDTELQPTGTRRGEWGKGGTRLQGPEGQVQVPSQSPGLGRQEQVLGAWNKFSRGCGGRSVALTTWLA